MNKAENFARVLINVVKSVSILLGQILRFILACIPQLLRKLFRTISARLRFSITFKTTLTYALIFSVILLILGILLTSAFGAFVLYQTNQSLEMNSRFISTLITADGYFPADQIENYADIENIIVSLFDEDGAVLYTTAAQPQNSSAFRTRLSPSTSIDESLHFETAIKLAGGNSKMEVSKPLAEDAAYLLGLIIFFTISFSLAIILTIIIGSRNSRKMLQPIDNMTRTAQSISAGDLNTRLDVVDSHDELKELAETINGMLNRLQISFEQQNTFVSDASHELRTPLAVIQGYANLLQRWGKEDQSVLQESLDAIKSEADNMKELVDRLLFLASADKKQLKLDISQFSLNELLEEVIKDSQLIDSQHEITGEINEMITLEGDRALIKQVLRIFIDNSIKYTPAGGQINIICSRRGNQAVITVEDTGQGIAQEDLPYIFNRFYKADKSRKREKGGAGLGLAIARWIIEQHHGKIRVESIKNRGTKVITVLPASVQP